MKRDSWLYSIRRKCQVIAHHFVSNEILSKVYFRVYLHKKLDLKNPKSFNEKMQWLKLYYYSNNQLVVKCSDKYSVRDYISEKGFAEHLTPLIGEWDRAEDIVWDQLPDRFVLKCNHGSAYNIVVNCKDSVNEYATKKQLGKWLREDFGAFNLELFYSQIKHRRIICECYLGNAIKDYKFFCFNGMPKFFCIYENAADHDKEQISFYSIDCHRIDMHRRDYEELKSATIPECFEEMKQAATRLCQDFPFVRVDFMVAEGKWFFSELTFVPSAGLIPFCPDVYDIKWGDELDLSGLQKEIN